MSESSYDRLRMKEARRRGAVDGLALAAVVLAVLSLFLIPFPLISTSAATVSIALAIASRARLKADADLSGARLGVAAVLGSAVALLLTAVPALVSLALVVSTPRG